MTDAADVADAPASGRAAVLLFALVPILAIVGAISIRALGVLESSDTIVARLIPHLDVARAAARSENVPLTLLLAVASAESAGRVDAVSPRGAVGLMQLMEPTAAELAAEQGVTLPDRTDPGTSLQLGARYLGRQITRFADDPRGRELALCAYNAGPRRVREWTDRRAPPADIEPFLRWVPFGETRDYVRRVRSWQDRWADELSRHMSSKSR